MALKLENKKTIVAEVAGVAAHAHSAVAAEYRGLTVEEMTQLRINARKAGVYMRVVRNTLARRAVEGTPFECMKEAFAGPLILAFAKEDPGSVGRMMKEFAKDHEKLVIKAVSIGGQLLPGKSIDVLAKLPSREEALASLMAVMKAPVVKWVRTLAEPHSRLVRAFGALRDMKQSQAN